MKTAILTVGLLLSCSFGYSQISKGGMPYSFTNEYNANLKRQPELVSIQTPDLNSLKQEDERAAEKGDPFRVAVNLNLGLDVYSNGTWETLPNGDRIWRMAIHADGAQALGLYFEESIWLPDGSTLFMYNKNKKQVIGAFTADLNNDVNTIYATEMLQGDEMYLEYYAPSYVQAEPRIMMSELVFFYRGVENHVQYFKSKGENDVEKADGCQVNVACSEANAWQDQVDAVVHYTFSDGGGTYVCSGSMIANTAQDCTPYLLTADHCGNKTSTSSLNTNVWYFKYENPNCSPGATAMYPKPSTTMTGAIFRASSKNGSHVGTSSQVNGSDFTLVELNSQPPSSYQVYYAGWDRRNTAATSGVGIHHPAGHDKKISTFTTSLGSATYNGGLSSAHWEVRWSATANGHGVTEGGSSGSPIFNQSKRIVGQLSGGSSYCTALTSTDLYGKTYYDWDLLGTNSNAQLKAWLDPTGSGAQFIDGVRPPCSVTPSPTTCASTVSSFPYSEGFESGLGQWSQVSGDDLDWTNQTGTTPSSNTGPSAAFEGSKYMYIEASSPNYPSKNGKIISPCLNLSSVSNTELTFAYHMFGADMGTLSVDVSADNGASWTPNVWTISGNQTNVWKQATVNLSAFDGQTIIIRFSGSTGANYTSDICIDDVDVHGATVTPPPPAPTGCTATITAFPYDQGFESGTGDWTQVTGDDLDWTNYAGSTPSSNTGASSAFEGSRYLYIEASSPNYPSKVARLVSPCFNLSGLTSPTMNFAYHMWGSAMGSLTVEVSTNGGTSWTSLGTISGDQTNVWKQASADLSTYAGQTIQVRMTGTTGANYTSDICIDGFSISGSTVVPDPDPTPSNCATTITSFPYAEGFESGIGVWAQGTTDDLDWTNQSGGTPSSSTGPTAANQGTRYMYIEASSPNYPSKVAHLISPCFNLSTLTSVNLTFSYHMYGSAMGSLFVDASTDGGTTWTNGIWSASGNQTNIWKNAAVDLSAYAGQTIKIRFRGVTGTNYTSDICIDGIGIQGGGSTTPPTTITYCQPLPTNGTTDGDYINGVVLGSISNINSGGGTSYKDYTSLSTNLGRSGSYNLTVYEGNYAPDRYAAWIDYNQDGDFADAGEKLGEFTGNSVGSAHTIGFSVPSSATLGVTRMRVRCLYNGNANGVDPCINGDYGETEDYTVNIVSSPKTSTRMESVNDLTFKVYPNPTSGLINVVFDLEEESTTNVMVYNMMGNVIYQDSETLGGSVSKQIDLTGLAAGVYQVVIISGDQKMIERVILR